MVLLMMINTGFRADESRPSPFDPPITALPHEAFVIRSDALARACPDDRQRRTAEHWLARCGGVVLNTDQPGVELHFFAEGIEAMTPADRLWEGVPRRAKSLQDLVDHAIRRAREGRRPISRLVITGHAGLPGCAALGGTIDDCVFEGRLSHYQRRQLARLRPYLADDAEIELRQCVTGRGEEGRRLLTALHDVTGAAAVSYLADFHFGDAANHPRVRVDEGGWRIEQPAKR